MTEPRKKAPDILKNREELYEQLRLMGADDEIIEIFRLSTFDQVAKLMMFIVVHAQAFADDLANIKKSR